MSIHLEKVCYIYNERKPGEITALKDISLLFEDHCFTALIGKTGSGKSTLIQHLNGLLLPTSGKVAIHDQVIDMTLVYKKNGKVNSRAMKKKHKVKLKDVKNLRKRVGLVFQFPEYQIFEETVLKDVAYGPKNFGIKEEEAIKQAKEALYKTGLDDSYFERSPFELSGGEKRRVAIAGILAMNPDILVLDEPTVGLDANGEENLMNLVTSLYESGTSIILATHNMDVVLRYAKRCIVLEKGEVVFDSTPLNLFQDSSFLMTSSLEPPKVFSFGMALIEKGIPLKLENIKDTKSLADEILRIQKGGKKE